MEENLHISHINHRALARTQHAGTLHVCMHAAACSVLICDKSRKKKSLSMLWTLYIADGWPAYGMSPTSSGNRTLFPHSIPGMGLLALQPGEVEDQAHFIAICPSFNDVRLKLFYHCHSITDNYYRHPYKIKFYFM